MEKRWMEKVALIVMKNDRRRDLFPVWGALLHEKRSKGWNNAKVKEHIRNPHPDIELAPADVHIITAADELEKYGVTPAEFWGLKNTIDAELLDEYFTNL